MSLYQVNFNVLQVILNNTQVCCLQLALVDGLKQNDMDIEMSAALAWGLHSILGRNVTPGMTYEVCSLHF